jgi:GH15 family glucan-1,4-alpha-glucosidase
MFCTPNLPSSREGKLLTGRSMTANLNLGVIGNCAIAALIDEEARVVWACLPRIDSEPVFCSLLQSPAPESAAGGDSRDGACSIEMRDRVEVEQSYLENSAVLRSVITDVVGSAVEVLDFVPRFEKDRQVERPPIIVRCLTPLRGRPMVRAIVRPLLDHGATKPTITRGSHHIRYAGDRQHHRLTTTIPISYVTEERFFGLDRQHWIMFGSEEGIASDIAEQGRSWLEDTLAHWRSWVRGLSIPFEWQKAVIRSAITLKLCMYEETGAIVAALTTSIPEAPRSQRNWDYRYCWLRDSYFVIRALNRLGVTRTMEQYIGFITNVVDEVRPNEIQPVYGISRDADLTETIAPALTGYRGMGPVRIGNQAYAQIQHDVYGSVILAAVHLFFDQRLLRRPANEELFEQLELLGHRAIDCFDQPDAGPWELRHSAAVHTFSSVMCWAACDRLARIAKALGRTDRTAFWTAQALRLRAEILRQTWNQKAGSFVSTFDGDALDASLLLLPQLGFIKADDPRFVSTVDRIGVELKRGDFIYRYVEADDFGRPETAFTICTFWYIEALAAVGRQGEARALFERMLARRNPLGMLSEDIAPETGELWGNFPQTYSRVGLINCAVTLSVSWEEAS